MRMPDKLSWPSLLALIVLALALAYFERQSGEPETGRTPPQEETADARRTAAGARPAEAGAGNFDYYSLVLSWSPTHCETPEGQDDEAQCGRGRRYGFILHGLWPQHQRGYPENCPTRTRPFVPQPVINDMMDIMPSRGLIIHEYRKHGTCSGLSPEGYFDLSRRLFASLRIPEKLRNPTAAQFMGPGEVIDAFVAANPQLDRGMLAVACRGPGHRLREVRVCFSKTGAPRACGANESQGQLCRSARMHVPPVR